MTYLEHPSKVVRLVAGGLVGYPPVANAECTVWFAIQDRPDDWEGLPAIRLPDDTVELAGIPMFAYDLNLGDTMQTIAYIEGPLVAVKRLTDGGNYTFRVWFNAPTEPGQHWRRLMEDLEPFDCWFDTWSERLVAISASETHAQAVADYLHARESASDLKYETGRSR